MNKKGKIEKGLVVALTVIILIAILGTMAVLAHIEASGVTEGIITDKAYHAVISPQPIYSPEKYMLQVKCFQDGEEVKHWISCTEDEWQNCRIGDYYRK